MYAVYILGDEGPPAVTDLAGRKVVVLGASAGIGRAVAHHAVAAGAEVLLCGRRAERLAEVRDEAGGGRVCPADLAHPEGVDALAEGASGLGSVDAVVSTVGVADLKRLEHMSQADWRSVLDTNVVGVNSAIRALLPVTADGGVVLALSSEVVIAPRWALGAYAASKAALEVSLSGWRLEYPRVRFGAIGVGATFPTEFGRGFDGPILGQAMDNWARQGVMQQEMMDPDHVGQVIVGLLGAVLPFPGVGLEHVMLRTPSPIVGLQLTT